VPSTAEISPAVYRPWAMRVPKGVRAAKCSERWIGLRSPVISAKPTTSEEAMVFDKVSDSPTSRSSK
jgi:hypothetical protein